MTAFAYLAGLLVVIGCMALIDARWRLVFWRAPVAAAVTVAVGVAFFLLWDAAGILLGVFFRGDSSIVTGIELAPELPLEEPVFLLFLCYLTLVLVLGVERMLRAREARRAELVPGSTARPHPDREERA
ncbi:lycopene cyclase domain-containing protein [Agromyces aurantiacus]|uniref:Lycopene cyclase domain-containing protein n=1 Tax=Agromyces aurantiacus TaxID=165814 RepID=A0ABV9R8N2_9MICO|nr:lycopene cyclase domain-containing protein [Agromyces aurantiacus]MBM7504568.1 lycopene cyclase domain-containing protein [Agromyces aurantiacus]